MPEALALQLYRRYLNGTSVQDISRDLGIPADRIQPRLRAAAEFVSRNGKRRATSPAKVISITARANAKRLTTSV